LSLSFLYIKWNFKIELSKFLGVEIFRLLEAISCWIGQWNDSHRNIDVWWLGATALANSVLNVDVEDVVVFDVFWVAGGGHVRHLKHFFHASWNHSLFITLLLFVGLYWICDITKIKLHGLCDFTTACRDTCSIDVLENVEFVVEAPASIDADILSDLELNFFNSQFTFAIVDCN